MARSRLPHQKQPNASRVLGHSGAGERKCGLGTPVTPDRKIISDLPATLSPTNAELALLRAFLAEEIDAILRDGD